MIKRTISVAVLVLALVGLACSRHVNTFNVREYPGATVGDERWAQHKTPVILGGPPSSSSTLTCSCCLSATCPLSARTALGLIVRVSGLPVTPAYTPGGSTCTATSRLFIGGRGAVSFHTKWLGRRYSFLPSSVAVP